MIRIAYLIRKTSGGMQTHINGLLSEVDRSKYEPVVITPKAPKLISFLHEAGIECHEIDMADSVSPKADLLTARMVARALRKIRPDILHIHGNKAAMVGWLASRLNPIKNTVTTVHNFPSNLDPSSKYNMVARQTNRAVLNSAKRLVAVSTELKHCLEDDVKIDSKKIIVIPNGIDVLHWATYRKRDTLEIRKTLDLPDDSILTGVVGRLVPFKGHGVLLKSMKHILATYPNAYLLIMGDGPLREKLEDQAKELDIAGNVKFLGFIDEPGRYMTELDIFVLPSINEPFGIVILEAMALGLPVVSTNAGGVPDIIEDGVSGLLAEPGDENSLAEAINRLMDDRELKERLARNGERIVGEKFTIHAMADRTFEVYEDMLGRS